MTRPVRTPPVRTPLRIGGFFSGIGGLEAGIALGLAQRGWRTETVFQVEQNPYALRVLEKHWPKAQRFTDVTQVTPEDLPYADIWVSGFPCQDLSVAGKRAGIHAARSGLFWTFAELVSILRPRIVVLENVPGIYTAGVDAVLGKMAEMRYDTFWANVRAEEVGAPHRRERWFCVGWNTDALEYPEGNRFQPSCVDSAGRSQAKLNAGRYSTLDTKGSGTVLADAIGQPDQLQRNAGKFRCTAGEVEGQRHQRERGWASPGSRSQKVADAKSQREGWLAAGQERQRLPHADGSGGGDAGSTDRSYTDRSYTDRSYTDQLNAVADTNGPRPSQRSHQPEDGTQAGTPAQRAGDHRLADPKCGQRQVGRDNVRMGREQQPHQTDSDGEASAQSRVGRVSDGLPPGVDGPARGDGRGDGRGVDDDELLLLQRLHHHRFPAGPGPEQHPWEPPRTRPRGKNDMHRLKALGNAVCPQQAAVMGRWLADNLLR